MRQLSILTENPYTVTIQHGMLTNGLQLPDEWKSRELFLLTDRTVWRLYGEKLLGQLNGHNGSVHITEVGETAKSVTSFGKTLEAMATAGLTRDAVLLALGGGVIGDLGGFAAACYLRGIDFVQIPTTLLAAVDSSVGGKTAINLASGKNLAGAFHQPIGVLLDPAVFQTLSDRDWQSGVAEMIKTGMLFDEPLFDRLARGLHKDDEDLSELLVTCIRHKAKVVSHDEKDHGQRQLLNFGHTFGHAVEARSDYIIPHGHAVAIGMAMITKACVKRGICAEQTHSELIKALRTNGLPTETNFRLQELLPYVQRDKKMKGETMNLVLVKDPGQARLERIRDADVCAWLEDAL